MKQSLQIIPIMLLCLIAKGQQFSTQIFFTDSMGNRDSITVGYDSLATDSIDAIFGEVNIIEWEIREGLDVRITNEWINRTHWNSQPGTYHTKKQIYSYDCTEFFSNSYLTIDIHTDHWPVTATWDHTVFEDSCREGSFFTSITPGGWWDTESPSDLGQQILVDRDSVTFISNHMGSFNELYSYKEGINVIPAFWLALGQKNLFTSTHDPQQSDEGLALFPNPTSDHFSIQIPQGFGAIESVQLFSTLGNLVTSTKETQDIDISQISSGLYVVVIKNKSGRKLSARIIKN